MPKSETQRAIDKLDSRIDKLQLEVQHLVQQRNALYADLISEAQAVVNDLRSKAGIGRSSDQRSPHATNPNGGRGKGRSLNDDQVREAREAYARGESKFSISRRFNLSTPAVDLMLKRETYRDVPDVAPIVPDDAAELAPFVAIDHLGIVESVLAPEVEKSVNDILNDVAESIEGFKTDYSSTTL